MIADLSPLRVLLVTLAGWINRHQQDVIEYLLEENRVLKEQVKGRRLRLTDAQRRRLAAKGRRLGLDRPSPPSPEGNNMKVTETLHDQGQSLWLDNITRDLLQSGTLKRYIDELSVTGLTSNPTIFDHAIKNSSAYDAAIRKKVEEGKSGEELFFELALEDLTRAADLLRPIWDRTGGVDGWVSLEVSPLLAHDTVSTLAAAKALHARAGRPNLLIKIPGTKEGLPAIEEAIFTGIPINVTLLFSPEHYRAAADAFVRGIERRVAAGLQPEVGSVASVFISRWDAAVANRVPEALRNQLGIAIAKQTYKAYRALLGSPRWQRVFNAGARPQRLLWASTGTKDPGASDVLYIKALAAPFTVNTMPESTLKALAEHGALGGMLPADGGDGEDVLGRFARAGIDVDALASQLRDEGAKSFVGSWHELMGVIASKSPPWPRRAERSSRVARRRSGRDRASKSVCTS
jgi:transaldolase